MITSWCLLFVISLSLTPETTALDNGLALTPPMGWMSWERFRCNVDCDLYPDDCISEKLYRKMADLLVSDGYLAAGYEYIILDDCWMARERDANNKLQADVDRFPSGIKALADYVHAKGLKLGIYEDYGTKTCGGYPGSIEYLELDAKTFASWEVDYVKFDGCYADPTIMDEGYPEFGKYLRETNRSIVYSCSWPVYQYEIGIDPNLTWIAENCNLWRNWDDIQDSWASVNYIVDWYNGKQETIAPAAGPGHWNDPDMLIIGNYGLSLDQSKSQMAIWALLAAPLIMSHDLRNIRPEFKEILLNKDIIAIDQDALGIQGRLVYNENKIAIWARPIEPNVNGQTSYAVAASSRRDDGAPYAVTVSLKRLKVGGSDAYAVTELFSGVGPINVAGNGSISFRLPPSGSKIFRVVATAEKATTLLWPSEKNINKKPKTPPKKTEKYLRQPNDEEIQLSVLRGGN